MKKMSRKQDNLVIEVKSSDDSADEGGITSPESSEAQSGRDQWKRRFDFLLACVGLSVGLGNVWRFPYLCYKNGGGAFLIPYFISVFAAGIPLFLLEVSLGQLTTRGIIQAWNICPLFKGLGWTSTTINFLVNCYYNVILAWALRYLIASFTTTLPWTRCDNWWNTAQCRVHLPSGTNPPNGTLANDTHAVSSDAVTEFWENRILGLSGGIEQVGTIQWELALCLLLSWSIIFMCICRGIKTSGTIMYFTATSPYVFMLILLIRTSLLDGALDGLRYYVLPNWEKLKDMAVWSDAGTQIFFSYALSLGALTALGSYNTFHHNSFRDCLLFAGVNTFTSLLAGCVVFTTLGNMAHTSNVSIDAVAEYGPGLAFVIYPRALGSMPASPFWSVCFFLMVLLLGVDSMFGGVEGFVAAIADLIPTIHASVKQRCLTVGLVCVFSYGVGLTMVTNGGMYVFQLFDYYSGSRIIVLVGFLETVLIGYVFGAKRYGRMLKYMYGFSFGWIPTIFLCVVTPLFTFALFVMSAIAYEELTYRRAGQAEPYRFPDWAVKLGWLIASSSLPMIPIMIVYQLCRAKGTFLQRLKYTITAQLPDHLVTNTMTDETNHRETISFATINLGALNTTKNTDTPKNHHSQTRV